MKQLLLILFIVPVFLSAQGVFTLVADPDNPLLNFSNTAANYKGCAWIDLDHNNLPDAFVGQKFLFRNLGNGQFERLPDVNGVTLGQAAAGSSWGDIDNDGDLDCITASTVSGLHYNIGADTFALANAILPDFENYRAWDCALADVDNNGLLDLTWVHADNFPPGSVQQTCRVYRQMSPGNFTPVSGYEFNTEFRPYTIPVWTDYDLDGDVDLFIGTGPGGSAGPDFCYRNMLKETGAFSLQRLLDAPFNSLQDGQVYNTVDDDGDGDLDICLTNYAGALSRMYRNNGGVYTAISTPFTVQAGFLTNAWADVDNDGDQDVIITRDGNASMLLYYNLGGTFSNAHIAGTVPTNACGLAFADYDNDGDMDFYVNGASSGRALFRNDTLAGQRKWVQFTFTGVNSNRSAIGTLVRLKVGGKWQIREVSAHNSFQSQHELRQHFGLNQAQIIDSVEVRWPSGLVQHFTQLAPNTRYTLTEGGFLQSLVSTAEAAVDEQIKVFPNPLTRECEVAAQRDIIGVHLFDNNGRPVPVKVSGQGKTMRLGLPQQQPPGVLHLEVELEGGRRALRLVLKM